MTQVLANLRTVSLNLKLERVDLPFVNSLRSKVSDIFHAVSCVSYAARTWPTSSNMVAIVGGPWTHRSARSSCRCRPWRNPNSDSLANGRLGYFPRISLASKTTLFVDPQPPRNLKTCSTTGRSRAFFFESFRELYFVIWRGLLCVF